MKKNQKTIMSLIILFLFTSCSKFELHNINEFDIDESSSKKRFPIELVCTHGGENLKNDKEYYYQTIAVIKDTKDTITILSEDILLFDKMDVNQLEFISVYSEDKSDMILFELRNGGKGRELKNINDLEIQPYKRLEKVAFNKKFSQFDGRKYQAMIGLIVQSQNN